LETSSRDEAVAGTGGDFDGLDRVLDDGLLGGDANERFERLFWHLGPDELDGPSNEVLKTIGDRLGRGELGLKDALAQYAEASDMSRWPIFILRPSGAVEKAEARLTGLGFSIVPSLASAYRILGLIAIRIPPALEFLRVLARRPDIQRLERSWRRLSLPAMHSVSVGDVRRDPQRLVDPSLWPAEIWGVREPIQVALIDSGLDARHQALQRTLLDQRAFRRGEDRVGDLLGHGTAVAGTIARLCPAARFMSAKVLGRDMEGNLDGVVRALGWFDRTPPDVLVCIPGVGTSLRRVGIVGSLLSSLMGRGVVVVLPVDTEHGPCDEPVDAVWVCDAESAAPGHVTVRAQGRGLRAPRSISCDKQRFPECQPAGWTGVDSAATAAAVVAGTAGLLIRVARFYGHPVSPAEIKEALVRGCDSSGVLDPQLAVDGYLAAMESAADQTLLDEETLEDPLATAPMDLNSVQRAGHERDPD
jgi:hypothetical protein